MNPYNTQRLQRLARMGDLDAIHEVERLDLRSGVAHSQTLGVVDWAWICSPRGVEGGHAYGDGHGHGHGNGDGYGYGGGYGVSDGYGDGDGCRDGGGFGEGADVQ